MSSFINIDKLKRDPSKIKQCLKIVGNSLVATKDIYIMFPERYLNKNLAYLDRISFVLACYCIVDSSGNYAVTKSPIMQSLKPDNIMSVNIDNTNNSTYVKLDFEKDSIVIPSLDLIQDASLLYGIILEFFIVGNIPWYLNYIDLSELFLESSKYTGNSIGNDPIGLEMLTSAVSKAKDGITLYKDVITKQNDIYTNPPKYVGLDKILSYDDTGSKLIGSYLEQGMTSALVNPEERTSDASELLRS